MNRFNLYIAADTGPIYIAHALKVPLVDIIGPVDPREQPPKDERSIQVVAEGVEPTSFVLKKVSVPSGGLHALQKISVAQVERAVDALQRN